ncbi:hypothetical protein J7L06_01525 [Candidatus Bathyarchaeota archaeon]|nr:hypothetical protein [Candidatus Bathyarchaeota archaeon]
MTSEKEQIFLMRSGFNDKYIYEAYVDFDSLDYGFLRFDGEKVDKIHEITLKPGESVTRPLLGKIYNPPESEYVVKVLPDFIDLTRKQMGFHRDVRCGLAILPSKTEEYGDDENLNREILEFLDYWHYCPVKYRFLDLIYAKTTYVYDFLPFMPIRRFLGPFGSGKTRWLIALGYVCYRPIITSGCSTDVSLVRALERWRGTAIIDEGDFSNSSLYSFIIKILNVGTDRRTGWYRRADEKQERDTVSYYVYGPKIVTSRREYKDVALESKMITSPSMEAPKDMPLFLMDEFDGWAEKLRSKLLLWRLRNYRKYLSISNLLEDKDFAKTLFKGLKISARIKQIIAPLMITSNGKGREMLKAIAQFLDADIKLKNPEVTLEIQAKNALKNLIETDKVEVIHRDSEKVLSLLRLLSSLGISREDLKDSYYYVKIADISREILGEEAEDKSKLTSISKRLSILFRSRDFYIERGSRNIKYVYIPTDFLKENDNNDNTPKNNYSRGIPLKDDNKGNNGNTCVEEAIHEVLVEAGGELGAIAFATKLESLGFDYDREVLPTLYKLEREGKIVRTADVVSLGKWSIVNPYD